MNKAMCSLAAAAISAVVTAVLAVPADAADVKIGVIYPLTGNAASAGQSARDAVHLGVDIVNTARPDLKNLPLGNTGGLPNLGHGKIVLDEADRLLDLGFAEELAGIIERLPQRRQNLLFSATFPPPVRVLAERLLHEPIRIDVPATGATQPAILQRSIHVDVARRTQLLRHTDRTGVVRSDEAGEPGEAVRGECPVTGCLRRFGGKAVAPEWLIQRIRQFRLRPFQRVQNAGPAGATPVGFDR